jgi:hypothetical protein
MISVLFNILQQLAQLVWEDADLSGKAHAWKVRNLVGPVADGFSSFASVYALVVGATRAPAARLPDEIWIASGCGVRARRVEEKAGHLTIGAATLMALPPTEIEALLARALALALGPHPPRSRLRPGWTLGTVKERQYQGDKAMTSVTTGDVAASALLHQTVAAHRFAGYLAERREDGGQPTDVYAGWRERCDDDADRARYATGLDLDAVDAASRPPWCPPLRDRLAKLTNTPDRIPLFPTDRPTVDRFIPRDDSKLSRVAMGRPKTRT